MALLSIMYCKYTETFNNGDFFSLCLIKKLFSQSLRAVCILYPDAIPFFFISHPVSPQLCYLFTRSSPLPELFLTMAVHG